MTDKNTRLYKRFYAAVFQCKEEEVKLPKDVEETVQRCLMGLRQSRELIVLRYFEDATLQQIAKEQNTTVSKLRSKERQVLKSIRENEQRANLLRDGNKIYFFKYIYREIFWRDDVSLPVDVEETVHYCLTSFLTSKERLVLISILYEGKTIQEVADIISSSPEKVKSLYRRALWRLRSPSRGATSCLRCGLKNYKVRKNRIQIIDELYEEEKQRIKARRIAEIAANPYVIKTVELSNLDYEIERKLYEAKIEYICKVNPKDLMKVDRLGSASAKKIIRSLSEEGIDYTRLYPEEFAKKTIANFFGVKAEKREKFFPSSSENPEKKYELTNESKEITDGEFVHTVYRIRALKDIQISPDICIKKGETGGFVEKEENLSHDGNCWIGDNAVVLYKAKVFGDAYVSGNALVDDCACVCEKAQVTGNARIECETDVFGNAIVSGDARATGTSIICDNARISGQALVSNYSVVSDDTYLC